MSAEGPDRPIKDKTPAELAATYGGNIVPIQGTAGPLKLVTLDELLRREIEPRENLLSPWLPQQGLCMVHAARGVGKTQLGLDVGYAVASGGEMFGRWQAEKPRGVLVLDGEMPFSALQERMAAIVKSAAAEPRAPLLFLSPDLQDRMPDIGTFEGQKAVNAAIPDNIDLVIVDNVSTLGPSIHENEADSWAPLQSWALQHRAKGRSVLLVHHSGKTGQQRGSSRKEDVLDTVLALRRPAAYDAKDGCVFEVHFEKARNIHGNDAAAFKASLTQDANGNRSWAAQTLNDSTGDKVAKLKASGLMQKEIADELGLAKSTVHHHWNKPS